MQKFKPFLALLLVVIPAWYVMAPGKLMTVWALEGTGSNSPPSVMASAGRPTEPTSPDEPSALQEQIRQYIQTLSAQQGFEAWKQAAWTSYPLGPGTHGWVVVVKLGGQEVGYLIVNATPDGKYELGEYGTGSNPLFSLTALYHSMIRQGLISESIDYSDWADRPELKTARIYYDAMHAYWRIPVDEGIRYFDAQTGDLLPISEEDLQQALNAHETAAANGLDSSAQMISSMRTTLFDPYEKMSWLTAEPWIPANGAHGLKDALNADRRITYVSEQMDGKIILAYAVTGMQEWNEAGPYVLLSIQNTMRCIPYSEAGRLGHYFQ